MTEKNNKWQDEDPRYTRALRDRDVNAAREVREALEEFEGLLREANPVVASRLLPGITDEELRRLEEKHDVNIPQEVAAVWRWHNGLPKTTEPGGQGVLGHTTSFLNLDDSLASGRERIEREVTLSAEVGIEHPFKGMTFVSWLDANVGYVIDITPGAPILSYLVDPGMTDLTDYSVLSVAERVGWLCTALRSRAWYADETGRWIVGDPDTEPPHPYEDAYP